jgi:hypothetical protein
VSGVTDVIMRKSVLAGRAALVPVDDEGRALLERLKTNRDVGVTVIQHRNPRHHRLFFAIVKFVRLHAVDAEGNSIFEHADKEMITTAIKLATGYVRSFVNLDTGNHIAIPKSISWASMGQTEFSEFFELAVNVICKRWMPPGTLPEDVRRELIEMVDGPHAVGERVP